MIPPQYFAGITAFQTLFNIKYALLIALLSLAVTDLFWKNHIKKQRYYVFDKETYEQKFPLSLNQCRNQVMFCKNLLHYDHYSKSNRWLF